MPKLKLEDILKIPFTVNRKAFEAFALPDDFYKNSTEERRNLILNIHSFIKKAFDTHKENTLLFTIQHEIAPDEKYQSKLNSPASDTLYYVNILDILIQLEDYFDITCHRPNEIEVTQKNNIRIEDILPFIKNINTLGQQLIIETINSFTSNINYRLDADEKGQYHVTLVSESLLQSIFLKMSDILNTYDIAMCKERNCKRPFLSPKNRPAKCCCHNHLTNYLRYKERHS